VNQALAAGVFLAAAAGNDGSTVLEYPAGCTGVVGVGASNNSDAHASFSNRNASVALTAPGVNVDSTWNDGGYTIVSGTSMSTPHVAACAALVRSANPSLRGDAIRAILQATAVDLGAAGYDTTFGWGRLDCGAAVAAAGGQSSLTPTPTSGPGMTSAGGKSLTISSGGGGVVLAWRPGSGQSSYTVARLASGAAASLPPGGLPPTAISFNDAAAPPGLDCYALFVNGTNPEGQSDLECAVMGFHSASGSPQNFALRMNQSSTASLTWVAPPGSGQDGYILVTLGGTTQNLPGSATSANLQISGPTCYAVGATRGGVLIGYTDLLCGIPGFSNLGAS